MVMLLGFSGIAMGNNRREGALASMRVQSNSKPTSTVRTLRTSPMAVYWAKLPMATVHVFSGLGQMETHGVTTTWRRANFGEAESATTSVKVSSRANYSAMAPGVRARSGMLRMFMRPVAGS